MKCPQCSSPLEFRAPRCSACGSSVHLTSVTTVSGHLAILEDPALDFPPGALLAERFTVLEKAGDGGMGVVYKAFDTSLDQEVALKLIRADLAGDEDFVDSFKQEVRLTRQIAHPNVCRVHDLGDSHGLLFFSMEWLEGETLSQKLKHQPAMVPERALAIAEEIGQALGAAHARGIVHRDLKPSNVMIDAAGAVHVMDFGIAVGPGSTAEAPSGTPAYMSPEQWRGEMPDARSDLYSLGLILLEMLGQDPPAPGETVPAQLPPPLRRKVGPILESLLEEDKEARCPSAEKAVTGLRRAREGSGFNWRFGKPRRAFRPLRLGWILSAAGLLAAVSVFAYLHWIYPWPWPRPEPDSTKLETHSPGWVYYQQGFRYIQDQETVRSIDDAIHMLHRATEADPNLAQAWARLAEAYWLRYEQTQLESSREEANRAMDRALALNGELPEVLYARGRGFLAEKKYTEAKEVLEKVVKRDPGLDDAWANLEVTYRVLGDYAQGLRAIQTAIKLNPRYFRHQVYLGKFFYEFSEYDRAVTAYRKALELKPTSLSAWVNLGATYLKLSRLKDAATALAESIKIEENALGQSNLGTTYYQLGQFEEAAKSYRRATELEPQNADYWGNLGDALVMLKQDNDAHAAYLRAAKDARIEADRVPTDPRAHSMLGLYCARARDKACALTEAKRAATMQPSSSDILFRNAVIHSIFGDVDGALDWLEKSVKLGLSKSEVQNDPDLVPLHDNPRYKRILELAS
jgi:eukaryotic-like serine/threonine-protein kinase